MADPVEQTPSLPADLSAAAPSSHEGATASTEAAHGEGGGGLPQFRFEYWGGQIFWLLIIFVVLFAYVSKVVTPRMRRALDERANTIADAVKSARSVQNEAEAQAKAAEAELAEARSRAQRIASEAKAKVKAQTAERQAAEEATLSAKLAESETRIRAARDQAMTSVQDIASETAAFLVEKLSGKAASAADLKGAAAQLKA